MTAFADRVHHIPTLGLGISTEYGAATTPAALDPLALRAAYPAFAAFLEIGVEVVKGLDDTAQRWVHDGLPTTYHCLDLNLAEEEDFDAPWLSAVARLADQMQPAWLCGDADLWHFGRRERGHILLLPPILSAESARQYAAGVLRLRADAAARRRADALRCRVSRSGLYRSGGGVARCPPDGRGTAVGGHAAPPGLWG